MVGEFIYEKIELKVLSPLHISSLDSIGPLEYFYAKKSSRIYLAPPNLFDSLGAVDKKMPEKLLEYCKNQSPDKNNKFSLTDFLVKNNWTRFDGWKILEVSVPEISPQLEIKRIVRMGGVPFIPGSSLKGVLRTAWHLREAKGAEKSTLFKQEYDEWDGIKNRKATEYFRKVLVSDLVPKSEPVVKVANFESVTARNIQKGVPDLREYICPSDSAVFEGKIGVDSEEKFKYLMSCLKEFGRKCLEEDKKNYRESKVAMQLLDQIGSAAGSDGAVVCKLGFGKGYFANSIGFALREKDPYFSRELQLRFKGEDGNAPNRIRIVNGVPPGWVKIYARRGG